MMMKKTSSRNQRANKGIKWKHVLQICILLGVCVWLIYQVKYSHDKKKEFYERDGDASTLSQNKDGLVKLGRKDLPNSQVVHKNERVVEDEDEEVTGEEEISDREEEKEKEMKSKAANEHRIEEEREEEEVEEEEEEEKNKQGEENEAEEEENKYVEEQDVEDDDTRDGGGAEDDIDEQDQGKTGEIDREDEILEEEKEREGDNGEKGIKSNGEDEEERRKVENVNNSDEIDVTVREAREEHYKADDASSAVSHESNNEKGNSDTNVTRVTIEQDSDSNNSGGIRLEEAESETSVNKTNTEEEVGDSELQGSDTRRETQSDDHPEAKSGETEPKVETDDSNSIVTSVEASGLVHNGTETTLDPTQEHNITVSALTPEGASGLPHDPKNNESDSTITISEITTNEDSMKAQSLNTTSDSATLEKITDAEVKKSSEDKGDDESDDKESSGLSSTDETNGTVDSSDNTIFQEEREALTDPQTLPDIRTETSEDEEVAEE